MQDKMQLLIAAHLKPSSRKRKPGPLDFVQRQNLAIELLGTIQVGHRKTDMVDGLDSHKCILPHNVPGRVIKYSRLGLSQEFRARR